MRFTDIVGFALSALYRQKTRTILTVLGVVIGSLVLLLSLSVGQGVREIIAAEWRRNDQLRRITVWPNFRPPEADIPEKDIQVKGEMSDERRERLRQTLIRGWQGRPKQDTAKRLTRERLRELAALDHVEAVVPQLIWFGVRLRIDDRVRRVAIASAEPANHSFDDRLMAGGIFTATQPRGALVSEMLLYQLGIRNESDVPSVLGKTLRLELSTQPNRSQSVLWLLGGEGGQLAPGEEDMLNKVREQLPQAVAHLDLSAHERATLTRLLKRPRTRPGSSTPVVVTEDFTITGVVRMPTSEEIRHGLLTFGNADTDVYVPADTAAEMYFRLWSHDRDAGIPRLSVRVDNEENVKEVDRRINEMGLRSFAPLEMLERVRFNVLMISLTTSFVALVALVVAGLGIANTLLMSVLERTHEIGVMKAVGARDRHIQRMFLVEGALIGLAGSGLGLLLGWLASYPLDRLAHRVAEQQANAHLTQTLFVFPWWLLSGVPLFVTVLTMVAAVYPARRAARVNAMTALRHE